MAQAAQAQQAGSNFGLSGDASGGAGAAGGSNFGLSGSMLPVAQDLV